MGATGKGKEWCCIHIHFRKVEDSKEENSRERRNKEVGLALLQGPLGW